MTKNDKCPCGGCCEDPASSFPILSPALCGGAEGTVTMARWTQSLRPGPAFWPGGGWLWTSEFIDNMMIPESTKCQDEWERKGWGMA